MNKIAPWLLPAVGLVLLVVNVVLLVVWGGSRASPDWAAGEEIESARRGLAMFEETKETKDTKEATAANERLAAKVASLRRELDEVQRDLKGSLARAPAPPEARPPRGHVIAAFDTGLQSWGTPAWGSGTALHATRPGMFHRGRGALALGYAYGDAPPAAHGPVRPHGKVGTIRLYARTRLREIVLAVGVEEESGARYEVRLPPLKPREGWRLVSVAAAAMGLARGSTDPDRKLDLAKIRAIYVADRTKDAVGGNILLIDDVTVELKP